MGPKFMNDVRYDSPRRKENDLRGKKEKEKNYVRGAPSSNILSSLEKDKRFFNLKVAYYCQQA
jgi:hypothetical protein